MMALRPQDYARMERAARFARKRMGLRERDWPLDDLVSVGWERVFRYQKTYPDFERYGYLHCVREMCNYLWKGLFGREPTVYVDLSGANDEEWDWVPRAESTLGRILETEEAEQQRQLCRRVLRSMEPRARRIIALHVCRGLPFTRLAQEHRVHVNTIVNWYGRELRARRSESLP